MNAEIAPLMRVDPESFSVSESHSGERDNGVAPCAVDHQAVEHVWTVSEQMTGTGFLDATATRSPRGQPGARNGHGRVPTYRRTGYHFTNCGLVDHISDQRNRSLCSGFRRPRIQPFCQQRPIRVLFAKTREWESAIAMRF